MIAVEIGNVRLAIVLILCGFSAGLANGHDWPMWRCDAQRSASAPQHEIGEDLRAIWEKHLTPRKQAWDDPLNLDLMTYDRVFEPIVMDGRLFVGFNDRDKLTAYDTETGRELWSTYAEGPVRLPPAGWNGSVYFCSDDGFLYCVDAASGNLNWKFSGAPNGQHAIGNRRITSAWPARGGPVIRDGTVYFAASIWPFMGTFIYALDAETGAVQWLNDSTGAQYIKQPHSAPSFAGVAPQGALVATEELLLVPGGRSVPAVFNRADGAFRYFEINAGGKGTGGSFVAANEKHFFVHTRESGTRAFHLHNGIKTAFMPSQPVLDGTTVYAAESEDDRSLVRAYGADQKVRWEIEADGSGDLIRAGSNLIAAGEKEITIIAIPKGDQKPRIVSRISVPQKVGRLIVADGKLFAVTLDGQIIAYDSAEQPAVPQPDADQPNPMSVDEESKRVIADLLAEGDAEGYAVWVGSSQSSLATALAAESPFVELTMVDEDAAAVDRVRRRLDSQGLYGSVTVHHSNPAVFMAPQHFANMVFVDGDGLNGRDNELISELYESVRPYGGVMHVISDDRRRELAGRIEGMNLEQAEVQLGNHGVVVRRVGALPGAADWTHQYGDVANSIKSNDRRVKLPLGVLWFGGSSNMDVLPRHGHGPPEQVIGGRLFIQGMNSLSARDVYTGRVLWKRNFEDLGTFDVYYDKTFDNTPLDTKYNQVHIPGANGRGTNYVVTRDRVYLVIDDACHCLDPATGETLKEIRLPKSATGQDADWGYIGVYKDVLIGGRGFARYRERHSLSFEKDKDLKANKQGFGSKSLDRAASVALVGFDRHSGEVLWQIDANHSFWHNGIVAGGEQIYCLDRNPKQVEEAMRRRGIARPETYRIVALDYRTGQVQWQVHEEIFGTWLGYSERHDLLLQAGAAASDRLSTETGTGMAVYSAGDGALQWRKASLKYAGPCILHNDLIITNTNSYAESAGAFYLQTGKQKLVPNPLTGQMQPWKLTRAYGCNNIIASENLLTFRSGAAGFYDLLTDAGTGNLGGFKSGCTSNLVVADGVLNAPDYTRTCSCAYQNQTSLALVHMPDIELWSVNSAASVESDGKRIERVGLNFGAPGDRRDASGLLWLEYPATGGPSPPISIDLNDEAKYVQRHSSMMTGTELPWVLASGVASVTDLRIGIRMRDSTDLSRGVPVVHASDDAEENEQGEVDLGSTDLELIDDSGAQLVGVRFNGLKLSRDDVIRDAYLQFTCNEASTRPTSLIIAAEDTGNAERFDKDSHDLSSRSLTKKEVGWDPLPWLLPNASAKAHRTPNLAPLMHSVIRRPDWKPGNSIAFLISGSGKRVAWAWNSKGDEKAAKLVVDLAPEKVKKKSAEVPYRVRLFFTNGKHQTGESIPGETSDRNEMVMDVYAQGQQVLQDWTLNRAGRGADYGVCEFGKVPIADELHLKFVPKSGDPVLSGIELVRQRSSESE